MPEASVINVNYQSRGSSLGVAAIVLGCVALLFCWVPVLGLVSTPLSGLGLLLASLGFLVSLFRGGTGIGYVIAGGALSGLALTIAMFVTAGTAAVVGAAAEAAARDANRPAVHGQP